MKQRINNKDLSDLTAKGKFLLHDWWKPEEGDHFTSGYIQNDELVYGSGDWDRGAEAPGDRALPFLTIGMMIEFLHNNDYDWKYENEMIILNPERLCDALWFNCVDILNKE